MKIILVTTHPKCIKMDKKSQFFNAVETTHAVKQLDLNNFCKKTQNIVL